MKENKTVNKHMRVSESLNDKFTAHLAKKVDGISFSQWVRSKMVEALENESN